MSHVCYYYSEDIPEDSSEKFHADLFKLETSDVGTQRMETSLPPEAFWLFPACAVLMLNAETDYF